MSSKTFPSLKFEHELIAAGNRFVIGIDEVGRGAIAGPVAVAAALLDSKSETFIDPWPSALADSKLMTAKSREATAPLVQNWAAGVNTGFISASQIDQIGITKALAMAAGKALERLFEDSSLRAEIVRDGAIIILDGSHNWLGAQASGIPVVARTKADRDCVSVACASVVAKVERDALMVELGEQVPGYLFEGHKGYASEAHITALRNLGPSVEHRVTWLSRILADEQAV
jgi:ribonuclease HII